MDVEYETASKNNMFFQGFSFVEIMEIFSVNGKCIIVQRTAYSGLNYCINGWICVGYNSGNWKKNMFVTLCHESIHHVSHSLLKLFQIFCCLKSSVQLFPCIIWFQRKQ